MRKATTILLAVSAASFPAACQSPDVGVSVEAATVARAAGRAFEPINFDLPGGWPPAPHPEPPPWIDDVPTIDEIGRNVARGLVFGVLCDAIDGVCNGDEDPGDDVCGGAGGGACDVLGAICGAAECMGCLETAIGVSKWVCLATGPSVGCLAVIGTASIYCTSVCVDGICDATARATSCDMEDSADECNMRPNHSWEEECLDSNPFNGECCNWTGDCECTLTCGEGEVLAERSCQCVSVVCDPEKPEAVGGVAHTCESTDVCCGDLKCWAPHDPNDPNRKAGYPEWGACLPEAPEGGGVLL